MRAFVRCLVVIPALVGALPGAGVTVLFNPTSPEVGPFPTNFLTVSDPAQKTGLRVNLPVPGCQAQPNDCAELALINQLDGFHLHPRLRVRFSGPVNPDTLRGGVYIGWLDKLTDEEHGLQPAGHLTPIDQVLYDPATNTGFAKPDEFLDQHRSYLLLVTNAVRDVRGDPVSADAGFLACASQQDVYYCGQLRQALGRFVAKLAPRSIVAASLFTTQSATGWLEKARDQIQNSSISLQPTGSKSVFALSELAKLAVRLERRVSPPQFEEVELPLVLLIGVKQIAFGSFQSPNFLDEQQVIATVPSGAEVAFPRASKEIFFQVFLPATPAPATGYPVVIAGHGLNGNRFDSLAVAASLAARGLATIAINAVGHGFGPNGKVVLTDRTGSVTELPFGGRAVDMNGDGVFDAAEGCLLLAGPQPVGYRDCTRQTALDLMQLVRAIKTGMDLTGDGVPDLDSSRIYYGGASLGAIYGTIFTAVEPALEKAALNVGGGTVSDIARWSPSYRPLVVEMLASRTPPLLNRGRDFDDDYVLRYRWAKIVSVPGALPIQEVFERLEWLAMPGDPIAYATHLWSSTLPGVPMKRVLFQFAKGDQTVPNPASTNLVRAANLREMTSYYRHDLARAVAPQLPEDPHAFIATLTSFPGLTIALAAQRQIAEFLAGEGTSVPDVNDLIRPMFGQNLFEVPDFLTEDLNFPVPGPK